MLLEPGFPSHPSPPFAHVSEEGGLGWVGVGDWRKVPLLESLGGEGFFVFLLFRFCFVSFLFCCWIVFGVVPVFVFQGFFNYLCFLCFWLLLFVLLLVLECFVFSCAFLCFVVCFVFVLCVGCSGLGVVLVLLFLVCFVCVCFCFFVFVSVCLS